MHLETSDTERIEPDGVVVRDGTKPFIYTLVPATGFDVWDRELAGDRGDRPGGSVGISAVTAPAGGGAGILRHSMTSGHIPVAAWFTRQCWPFAYRDTRRWGRPPCSRWNG